MNMLIFEESELEAGNVLRVRGERAVHIINVLGLKAGDSLRIGKLDAGIGRGIILEAASGEVLIAPGDLMPEADQLGRDLLLAMPRPQTLKKVLQTAACMGVSRICLIGSSRVEKSYFSSLLLRPEEYKEHLRLGLEQGISTRAPEVLVLSDRKPRKSAGFAAWLQELFPQKSTRRIIASPATVPFAEGEKAEDNRRGVHPLRVLPEDARRIVFAIGPEGGWQPDELEAFLLNGFEPVCLGNRILRVETAVTAILAQHDLFLLEKSRIGPDARE